MADKEWTRLVVSWKVREKLEKLADKRKVESVNQLLELWLENDK